MTIREKLALRTLLLVARLLAPEAWSKDLKEIDTQISVYVREKSQA